MFGKTFIILLLMGAVSSTAWANTFTTSFFEMNLKSNSIYTSGKMTIFFKLTDRAIIEEPYTVRLSIFVANTLVWEQVVPISQQQSEKFEVSLPAVRNRTVVRCRAELFINGQFAEAKELPLTIWPALKSLRLKNVDNHIWLFDASGKLQEIFQDFQISFSDALFQPVRDFEEPGIIFIGENIKPEEIKIIDDLLDSLFKKDVPFSVVFLKQSGFLVGSQMQIAEKAKLSAHMACNPNSPLLEDLNKLDIIEMCQNGFPLRAVETEKNGWEIESAVCEIGRDVKEKYGFLLILSRDRQRVIYCQFPITDDYIQNPRSGVLLRNLIKFVNREDNSDKNK